MAFDLLDDWCRKEIVKFIKRSRERIEYNTSMFNILEGDLKSSLEQKLQDDLGHRSFKAAHTREAPINYFRKVIDKLSTIYQTGVVREVVGGRPSDDELLRWYEETLQLNPKLNINNEFFNAFEYSLLFMTLSDPEPITGNRKPFVRSIPNHEFLVMNTSNVDPTSPDVIITFQGQKIDPVTAVMKEVFFVYTDIQFIIMDGDGNILIDEMQARELDGSNPQGVTPFAYTNTSQNMAMPVIQTDNLDLALLIPVLLTDLNYAAKFQSFSMFVAIDVDDQGIEISPNAILSLKSDGEGEKPSFDVIKPTVDIGDVLSLASSQISLWLTSKGIRPGTVGTLEGDSFQSGISKIIDESDTFENRKKQIEVYESFEKTFWTKLLKIFHPTWVAAGAIEQRTLFSQDADVITKFPEPKPLQTRKEVIEELRMEIDIGLETRRGALRRLNPDMSDEQIDDKLAEIDAENAFSQMFEVADGEEQDRDADTTESA